MKRLKRAQPMVTRLCARREQRSARQLLVEYKKKVFSMISNANVIYILIKKCTIFNILRVSTFLAFCVFFFYIARHSVLIISPSMLPESRLR